MPGAPELPLVDEVPRDAPVRRWQRVLDARQAARLDAIAAGLGLSRATLLLAAYAAVLRRWSGHRPFALTLTLFDRPPIHPQIGDVVGDFTTVLLLQVPAAQPGLEALARSLHDRLLEDLNHRQFSGVRVARLLRRHRGNHDAMRFVFTHIPQGSDVGAAAFPFGSRQRFRITRTAGVWLDNQVVAEGQALRLHWDVVEHRFPPGLVADMFASYCALIDQLLAAEGGPGRLASLVAPLPPAQLQRRSAPGPLPAGDYLLQIAHRCREHPGAVAVIADDRRIGYGALWREAAHFARQVSALRSGDECVAVHLQPGWRQVVAVLAIQIAGLAYVPLSTRWPTSRLAQVVREHGIRLVVVDAGAALPAPNLVRLEVGAPASAAGADHGAPDPDPVATLEPVPAGAASPLAYVIFTSGSTGSPKGVMMRREAVTNTFTDLNGRLRLSANDRVLALSDLGFDLSVFDVFGLLAVGGALVMPPASARLDPSVWWHMCATHGVTIWNTVPALFDMLADYALNKLERLPRLGLRWIMLSGDWIPLALPGRARRLAPDARLLSLGGATEAGIWSVCHPVATVQPGWRSIPYGRPLRGQSCAVVDEAGFECPAHVTGELLIRGGSLSDGYWHRRDLTDGAFFDDATGVRSYRTGDLARYGSDGVLELLGRKDSQVKISGHRVECMEVEHVVAASPGVREAIVLALPGAHGPELHAAVALDPGTGPSVLEACCRASLPDWMVPRHWHLDAPMGLNDNGKVDRRAVRDWLLSRREKPPDRR